MTAWLALFLLVACLEEGARCDDEACVDNADFLDPHGYSCEEWVGFDCWGPYNYDQNPQQLVENCPLSCVECPGVSHVSGDLQRGRHFTDAPFKPPEIFAKFHSSYHPICFNGDSTHNTGVASAVCASLGHLNGGTVVKMTGEVYSKDAIPLKTDNCNPSLGSLANCIEDGNGFSGSVPEECRAGSPIGVEIVCDFQCRPFHRFDKDWLPTCYPYLDNSTSYYLADTDWLDNVDFSPTQQFAANIHTAMNAVCAANVVSLMCRSVFKECKEVGDPFIGKRKLPSLLCRSECERYLEVWNSCIKDLEKEPDAKYYFEMQMQDLVKNADFVAMFIGQALPKGIDGTHSPFRLLPCDSPGGDADKILGEDAAIGFVLGQNPPELYYFGEASFDFPKNMETVSLYPETSSVYTLPDGTTLDVPCFTPSGETRTVAMECPFPFVSPLLDDHVENCIQPCPVQAYTDEEYTMMWGISSATQLVGLCLNLLVVTTWMLGGRRHLSKQPYQYKICVFAGLMFGLVGTLPSLILKYTLPCECETEECTGTSIMCKINRASVYFLLSILINLCALMYQVSTRDLIGRASRVLKALSTGVPILLAIVGYALEGDTERRENANLNIARHAFSCSMRFPDMATEWLALWVHFLWSGVLTMAFCIATWRKIGLIIVPATPLGNFLNSRRIIMRQRRRLLQIAVMVSLCLLLNAVAMLSVSTSLDEWNRTSEIALACATKETWNSRNWPAYGLTDEVEVRVCSQDEVVPVLGFHQSSSCQSDCWWFPQNTVEYSGLGCAVASSEIDRYWLGDGAYLACDCPCHRLVEIERPSVLVLTMAYLAQSLVVVIVGINLGFSSQTWKIWKRAFANLRERKIKPLVHVHNDQARPPPPHPAEGPPRLQPNNGSEASDSVILSIPSDSAIGISTPSSAISLYTSSTLSSISTPSDGVKKIVRDF